MTENQAHMDYVNLMWERKAWSRVPDLRRVSRFMLWQPLAHVPTEWTVPWRDVSHADRNSYNRNMSIAFTPYGNQMEELIGDRKPWKMISDKTMPMFRMSIGDE